MRSLTASLVISIATITLFPIGVSAKPGGLAARVAQLEARVAELEEILQFVRVEDGPIRGLAGPRLAGPHWIIEGANVHVRSGGRGTSRINGLGNLIVGYNERLPCRGCPVEVRTGSHNLVIGRFHSYTSFGGFVAGGINEITGESASVCGGRNNKARGRFASISGGHGNVASGFTASVSGGELRTAPDDLNWAAGSLQEPN